MIGLLKPQFELEGIEEQGGEAEEFKGVVPAGQVQRIIEQVISFLKEEGLTVNAMTASPITGRRGNREYLLLLAGTTCDIFTGQRFTDKDPFTG